MPERMTERETVLAARIKELEAEQQAALVRNAQGGVFEGLWRAANKIVPAWLAGVAVAAFIGNHAVEYYMQVQIGQAERELKLAKQDVEIAKGKADNALKDGTPLKLAKAKADLKLKEEQAEQARAEADAVAAQENDTTLRIQTVEAEIDTAQQKAKLARAQADAKATKLGGGQTLEQNLAVSKLRLSQMQGAWARYQAAYFDSVGTAGEVRAACQNNDFANEIGCPAQYITNK